MNDVRGTFRRRRRYLDITQQEIADAVGISRVTYNRVETGVQDNPGYQTILRIEQYLTEREITDDCIAES